MRDVLGEIDSAERLEDCWRRHAQSRADAEAVIHWTATESPRRWKWGELLDQAEHYAGRLRDSGVLPGEVCAIIVRHHPQFYPLYMGVSLLDAIPAVMAYPNSRLHPDKFRQGLEGMGRHSGLDWIITERELNPILSDFVRSGTSTVKGILNTLEPESVASPYRSVPNGGKRSLALLQHSSGTTGLQKAVALSHEAVLGNVRRYGEAIQLTAADRIVSWLPLYHDMGLIAAFHLSLAAGVPLIQLDPFEWVQAPVLMLLAVSDLKATIGWQPNFAYHLMADRIPEEDLEGVRLESLRMLINCSEPVRAEAHERFARRFAGYGLNSNALGACYAMAEATFAVTQTLPGVAARVWEVDRDALAAGKAIPGGLTGSRRECVSSGRPIADCRISVIDENGNELGDDNVGELVIESASIFDGYRNNPVKTAEVLRDGRYSSGDIGFRHEGEYYIIGRKNDLIIVAGKNIYPEDIEDAVDGVPGVLPGRVVAFGLDNTELGTEQIAVVVESDQAGGSREKEIRQAVLEVGTKIGVTISQVFVVEPRWLIKSSAGKPSRKANRERILRKLAGCFPSNLQETSR